jgi:hypothetical protein
MSVRVSTGLPSSCSGAMYGSVPAITPAAVTETSPFGREVRSSILASPKSSSRAKFAEQKPGSLEILSLFPAVPDREESDAKSGVTDGGELDGQCE